MDGDMQKTSMRDKVLVIIFASVFILAGIGCLVYAIINVQRAWASRSWPTVQGVVLSAEVKRSQTKHGNTTTWSYRAVVRYDFQVDGKPYSGDKISFVDFGSRNASLANTRANRYAAGKTVTVHYDPSNPQICVLEPGFSVFAWMSLIGGFGFLSVGAALGYVSLVKARRAKGADSREKDYSPED